MLCSPPYSLVNLPENLMPITPESTYEEFIEIIDEYK